MQLIYYGDTLEHHGIKGQKWGRRRFQNADGSLTPMGRQHYGVDPIRGTSGKKATGKIRASLSRQAPGLITSTLYAKSSAKANKKLGVSKEDARRINEFGAKTAAKIKAGKTTDEKVRRKRIRNTVIAGAAVGAAMGGIKLATMASNGSRLTTGREKTTAILAVGLGSMSIGAISGLASGALTSSVHKKTSTWGTNKAYK